MQQQGIREALEALGLCYGRERLEIPVGISGIYSDRLGSDQIFPLTTEKQIQGFNTITSALHVFRSSLACSLSYWFDLSQLSSQLLQATRD